MGIDDITKKLVAMVYDEGSRSHKVQEKAFFQESDIKLFVAGRAPLYSTIVKDLEEYNIDLCVRDLFKLYRRYPHQIYEW